jgi:hypothetical protein
MAVPKDVLSSTDSNRLPIKNSVEDGREVAGRMQEE